MSAGTGVKPLDSLDESTQDKANPRNKPPPADRRHHLRSGAG